MSARRLLYTLAAAGQAKLAEETHHFGGQVFQPGVGTPGPTYNGGLPDHKLQEVHPAPAPFNYSPKATISGPTPPAAAPGQSAVVGPAITAPRANPQQEETRGRILESVSQPVSPQHYSGPISTALNYYRGR